MLHAAVLLDLSVTTVVVRYKQSLRRNEFSGTSAAKEHYCVLERSLVDAVDVFSVEFEALFLHIPDSLGYQRRQPHAFVSADCQCGQHGQQDDCQCLFHSIFSFLNIFI